MARIKLSESRGFTPIEEGEHLLKVFSAQYVPQVGRIEIEFINKQGKKLKERFSLLNNKKEINEKALNAFSYYARTILGDWEVDDIDPEELVGNYIIGNVVHQHVPKRDNPDETITFVNLDGVKETSDTFEDEAKSEAEEVSDLFDELPF